VGVGRYGSDRGEKKKEGKKLVEKRRKFQKGAEDEGGKTGGGREKKWRETAKKKKGKLSGKSRFTMKENPTAPGGPGRKIWIPG